MNFKQKLAYTALGGLLVTIGMMLGTFLTDHGVAQDDMTLMEFNEIKCRRLSIVDNRGRTHAVLQKTFERMSDTADVIQIYNDDRRIVYSAGFDPKGNGVWKVNNRGGKRVILCGVESDSGNGFSGSKRRERRGCRCHRGRPWRRVKSVSTGGRRSESSLRHRTQRRFRASPGHKRRTSPSITLTQTAEGQSACLAKMAGAPKR